MKTELIIRAPAGHPAMATNQSAAREMVEAYTARLLAGLGVETALQMHWEKQKLGLYIVEALINGIPAKLRYTTATNMAVSPLAYATALSEDILRNRLLFVTAESVAEATKHAHPTFQRLDENSKLQVARILLAQGFGLQRIERHIPDADSPDKMPEAWAEACIGDLEAAQLVIHAHPNQIDPDDDPNDLNRLIESAGYFVDAAFKIKGVPFPKIKGEKRGDFAPDEMAFQINDLIFPTRKIGDMQGENLQFVNFLTNNGAFFLHRGSVNFLLSSLESVHPNLLALTRTRFSADFIVAILRNLAIENISIRPLVRILEILAGGGQDVYQQQINASVASPLSETVHLTAIEKTPAQLDLSDWTELVRMNLKNAIINRALPHFEESFALSCFYLESAFFQKIARFDTLSTTEQTRLRETLHRQIAQDYLTPAGKIRPLITSAAWRKKISELIAFEFPDTPVFSLQECLPRIVARFDKMIQS